MDVLRDELRVPLEAARRKDRRLGRRLAEANATRGANECVRQSARVEPLADRARVPRLVLHHGRAERLEPRDPVVELFPDDALQLFVAGRTLRTEVVPLAETPDDAARQEHRPARPCSFLVHERRRPELACACSGGQPRHPRTRYDYSRANPGLCSTYSMRTRSGPHTKTARVFAASTTLSTMSRFSASAITGRLRRRARRRGSATACRSRPDHRDGTRRTRRRPRHADGPRRRALGSVEAERRVVLGRLLGDRPNTARRGRGRIRRPSAPRRGVCRTPSPRSASTPSGSAGARTIEIRHAQRDVLERTWLARAFGREQRQLAAPRIGADQRERVLPVDDVHPDVLRQEIHDRLAIRDPEGDVIQGLGLHVASVPTGTGSTETSLPSSSRRTWPAAC